MSILILDHGLSDTQIRQMVLFCGRDLEVVANTLLHSSKESFEYFNTTEE
jgi:hypothetical protein